jgi:hypothetical protein
MRGQPVRQRPGVPARQQVERRAGLAVDQQRAVVPAAPDREVIDPEDPRRAGGRVGGGHHQAQQRLPARRRGQVPGEPGGRPAGQRDRDVPQHARQQGGLPRVPGGQARDLLGERRALTSRGGAEEPADGQPDHHPPPADRSISQPPPVAAVHPARHRAARRARCRARPRPGGHEQQPGRHSHPVNNHPGQVRQDNTQLNGTMA